MPDLSTNCAGIKSPNPFWLASATPTNSGEQVMRAFEYGWGGAVWKTLGQDPPGINVSSRYGSHTSGGGNVVEARGYFVGTATSSMKADDNSPNQLACPCKDWTCTSCAHEPIFLGVETPTLTYSRRQDLTSCQ